VQAPVAASASETAGAAAAEPVEPAEPEPPADAPLEIRLRAEAGEGRLVTAVVEVRGGRARLSRTLGVEHEVNGRFEDLASVAGLELRVDCQTPAPECVELVAGAELRPPPWLGTQGDAQCVCTRCGAAPAGRYRFVVRSCDGRQRVESPIFELP
jgi:hypothetical protein